MTKDFCHLHLHTDASHVSFRDSMITPETLAERLQEIEQPAVAVTDHGSLSGIMHSFRTLDPKGIKLIAGIEAYYVSDVTIPEDTAERNHIVLLASTQRGYMNLCSMLSYAERFHKRKGYPRFDTNLMSQHSEDVIALTGCMQGPVFRSFSRGQFDAAVQAVDRLRECFGPDNVYIEAQGRKDQYGAIADQFARLARKVKAPLVGTCDAHMLTPDDWGTHRVLVSLRFRGSELSEGYPKETHVQDGVLAHKLLKQVYGSKAAEEMIASTLEIRDRCSVPFERGRDFMPSFGSTREEEDKMLQYLAVNGLPRVKFPREKADLYVKRLRRELAIIHKLGFSAYFLLVHDIVRYAKSKGVEVGPGRGSAAGSVVCWTLGITEPDPIEHGLYFERFLNPDRVSYPDIDLDFGHLRRDDVIQYIRSKYGTVLPLINWNTIHGRSALKDVGRVMGLPFEVINEITRVFPPGCDDIDEAIRESKDVEDAYQDYKDVFDIAKNLQGLRRQTGRHAAAVAVLTKEAASLVPVILVKGRSDDRNAPPIECAGYDMYDIEDMRILKVDVLGLATLTVEREVRDLCGEPPPDWNEILGDRKGFEIIRSGKTAGIFQLESRGMTQFLTSLRPRQFEDIVLALAGYRPGPLEFLEDILDIRKGMKEAEYVHDCLKPIFGPTYGWPIYQEQIMQMMRSLAGFSMSEADMVRKAMGKKLPKAMAEIRSKFVRGCVKHSRILKKEANAIFDWVERFAGYAFNKSHAVSYSMTTMQTAALKARHPEAFFSALINSEGTKKMVLYAGEAASMGVRVLAPDINESDVGCTFGDGFVRLGLGFVKNLGVSKADLIVTMRQKIGRFGDIEKFVDACPTLDKRSVQSLIHAGAFDQMNPNRNSVSAACKETWPKRKRRQAKKGLDGFLIDIPDMREEDYPNVDPIPVFNRCLLEEDTIGFAPSVVHLRKFLSDILGRKLRPSWVLRYRGKKRRASMFAIVNKIRKTTDRKNRPMMFIDFTDFTGELRGLVFASQFRRLSKVLKLNVPLVVHGEFIPPNELIIYSCSSLSKKLKESGGMGDATVW